MCQVRFWKKSFRLIVAKDIQDNLSLTTLYNDGFDYKVDLENSFPE